MFYYSSTSWYRYNHCWYRTCVYIRTKYNYNFSGDPLKHNEAIVTGYNPSYRCFSISSDWSELGSGFYCSWYVNLDGATGGDGSNGTSGTSGSSGTSGTSGTTGTSGTYWYLRYKWYIRYIRYNRYFRNVWY